MMLLSSQSSIVLVYSVSSQLVMKYVPAIWVSGIKHSHSNGSR
uniref:Uncharacterized protein n=1 Tax=Parascaris equorum TaxID=6256 RepID=A0A914R4G7_PAREQ